ncbi:MAG: signal peptidase II [Planctomycetota bacterium]
MNPTLNTADSRPPQAPDAPAQPSHPTDPAQPSALSQPSAEDLAALQRVRDPLGFYTGWKALFDVRRHEAFWFWSFALALIDQASKYYVFARLPTMQIAKFMRAGGSLTVIPGFFDIHSTCNYGAAFSAGTGQVTLLTVISIVVLIALAVWRHFPNLLRFLFAPIRDFPRFAQWGICLVFAGALGNLYDRLVFGYVRDFLDFRGVIVPFTGNQFPIFNVADSFLTVGIIMFLIVAWFFAPKSSDGENAPA